MGYYVSGSIAVTTTSDMDIALGLDLDALATAVSQSDTYFIDRLSRESDPDVVCRALGASMFEVNEVRHDEASGATTRFAWFNEKWEETVDDVLAWLASHGAAVNGEMTGEDDTRWAYVAELNGTSLLQDGMESLPNTEIERLRADAVLAASVRGLAAESDDAAFGAAVRALLS